MEYSSYIEDPSLMSPLSYVDYFLSHKHDFVIIAFTVFIASSGVLFGPIFARMRVKFRFDQQINKLTGKLCRTEADTSLYLEFIQRTKQISSAISATMEKLEYSLNSMPLEVQKKLVRAVGELTEELAKGLCGNIQKETLNVREMLYKTQNHFTDYLQSHDISVKVTCPEDLTVVADPLFVRLVLLNVFGFPICSTQNHGQISVAVSQNNGYAHVEIKDKRNVLSGKGQQHLKFPREFLAKDNELRQLCIQNGWGYEFRGQKDGQFYTKVSIPLQDYQAGEDHLIALGTVH
jgi:hypothetical protein